MSDEVIEPRGRHQQNLEKEKEVDSVCSGDYNRYKRRFLPIMQHTKSQRANHQEETHPIAA